MSDDFEARLESLARRVPREDPTAAWKDEVLSQAQARNRKQPPLWLTLPLAACWVAIAVLNLSRPEIPLPEGSGAMGCPSPVPALFALQSQLDLP